MEFKNHCCACGSGAYVAVLKWRARAGSRAIAATDCGPGSGEFPSLPIFGYPFECCLRCQIVAGLLFASFIMYVRLISDRSSQMYYLKSLYYFCNDIISQTTLFSLYCGRIRYIAVLAHFIQAIFMLAKILTENILVFLYLIIQIVFHYCLVCDLV